MLNVNTQKGQSIYIGDNHVLKLKTFNEDEMEIHICEGDVTVIDNWETFCIGAGKSVSICHAVGLQYVGSGHTGVDYAILGFTAPRHIRILGEWKTGNIDPGPADRAKLSQMTDASLVYYASMNAKTPLEHELMNRFKKRLRK